MESTPHRFGPPSGTTYDERSRIRSPFGQPCRYCQEPIARGDSGIMIIFATPTDLELAPVHIECEMRKLVGGVNHQLKRCICCGGTEPPDPPGISRRHAARLAYKLSPPFAELTQMS